MRRALGYLVAAMWGAVLLGGAFRPAEQSHLGAPRPQAGYLAPPFTLQDLEGNAISLSDLQGEALFLNFWASWCGPCRMEMPEIERLYASLPPNTAILTVNVTNQERSVETAARYLADHGYTFPVLTDPDGAVSDRYRVISLPTSLFISPDGLVVHRVNGPLPRSAMVDYLKAAGR